MMQIAQIFKLKHLYYGHPGKLIIRLKGRFDVTKMEESQPIQLGQMKCGCWAVLDGNNRIALILKKYPEAVLSFLPERFLLCYSKGQWDEETFRWWNPYPKTFNLVMNYSHQVNKIRKRKSSFKNEEEYRKAIDYFMQIIEKEEHICNFLTKV